jgi:hypothetical protein
LLAVGEVDRLDDFENVVILIAEMMEGLVPWELGVVFLFGISFDGLNDFMVEFMRFFRVDGWLSLFLVLEWWDEGQVLADGVISLAFTMNGFLHGLVEIARLVFVLFGGLTVQVTTEDSIDASGVQDEVGHLSLLHVDGPNRQITLDLEGSDDTLLHGEFNWGFEEHAEFFREFNGFLSTEFSISPSTMDFIVDFNKLDMGWLQVDFVFSDNGQDNIVVHFKSSILGIDFSNSSHNASTDGISVTLSNFPSKLGRYNPSHKAKGEKANSLHGDNRNEKLLLRTEHEFQ